VTQGLIAKHFILILSANFMAMNVSFFFQFLDNSLNRSLGNSYFYCNLAKDHVGVAKGECKRAVFSKVDIYSGGNLIRDFRIDYDCETHGFHTRDSLDDLEFPQRRGTGADGLF